MDKIPILKNKILKKKKKIWPLQNDKSFLFPPFTFIWSHDRRLDKRTPSYPKYAPIEQSGREQETSEVPDVFNVFLASFFGRDKSCCGLWSAGVSLTKATAQIPDMASLVLKACRHGGKTKDRLHLFRL